MRYLLTLTERLPHLEQQLADEKFFREQAEAACGVAEADREQALKDLAEAASKLAACDALPRYFWHAEYPGAAPWRMLTDLDNPRYGDWVKVVDLDHVLHPEKKV